jgi:hypothetical protein
MHTSTTLRSESLKERDHLEYVEAKGIMTSKCITKKQVKEGVEWIHLAQKGPVSGSYKYGNETLGFINTENLLTN